MSQPNGSNVLSWSRLLAPIRHNATAREASSEAELVTVPKVASVCNFHCFSPASLAKVVAKVADAYKPGQKQKQQKRAAEEPARTWNIGTATARHLLYKLTLLNTSHNPTSAAKALGHGVGSAGGRGVLDHIWTLVDMIPCIQ